MRNVVNQSVLFFLLMLVCMSCETQKNEKSAKSKAESRKELKKRFSEAVQGIPLTIPLIEESDPSLFLMPVSNGDDSLRVDRLYLVDTTGEKFDFERDIYSIDSVDRMCIVEDSMFRSIAFVSNKHKKSKYAINGVMFYEMMQIKDNQWDYPSALKLPVTVRAATPKEIREVYGGTESEK